MVVENHGAVVVTSFMEVRDVMFFRHVADVVAALFSRGRRYW